MEAAKPVEAPKADPNREALVGLVERVTCHNPETGFCVLRVKARGQRDLVTVVGAAAMISAGEFVQASGSWINDRTHGVQFKAAFLRAAPPTTLEGIERYLGSGMIARPLVPAGSGGILRPRWPDGRPARSAGGPRPAAPASGPREPSPCPTSSRR